MLVSSLAHPRGIADGDYADIGKDAGLFCEGGKGLFGHYSEHSQAVIGMGTLALETEG
jgi:hypothetical protein